MYTLKCCYFPSCTAAIATPPVDPWTRRFSPASKFPLLTKDTYAVKKAVWKEAASMKLSIFGFRCALFSGTTTNSEKAPLPQEPKVTSSPISNFFTSVPISLTIPCLGQMAYLVYVDTFLGSLTGQEN